MDHPRPNLRYLSADDLDDKTFTFNGLEVDSQASEKLGHIEGFIVDSTSGRPYHVVVGAGGWFKHKHFLLPIGHVALSPGHDKVVADVTKARVERFPGFNKDEFTKLSDDDLTRMNTSMIAACCPTAAVDAGVSEWETSHYAYPSWWQADFYRPDRVDRTAMDMAGATHLTGAGMPPVADIRTMESGRARETVTAREGAGDTSPHMGGRAQPGDVLGVETGGERTYVGDTSEDENKRRRDAGRGRSNPD